MGQTTSTVNDGARLLHPVAVSGVKWVNLADEIEISGDCDYTKEIPDECLACVFHFLAGRDRTHCSLVCKCWLCVEGQSRYRLSINAKSLKKLSYGSCNFGAKGMNVVLDHCATFEELSIKRLRGIYDRAELISAEVASSSLKSICLKELVNGQSFEPLVIGCENLKTLRIIRCLGYWDRVLETIGNGKRSLVEIHLEKLQVSDVGLLAISKCLNVEILHIVKIPECSNLGLVSIAESCKQLRKLHIDGWRINRIGDEGLIAIAEHCLNLQELVLIGVNWWHDQLGIAQCDSEISKLWSSLL
ncbi:hypothetical protein K2173_022821 [Erythroxylum novogranatense]|uniref:COI1 F-box domain-containing protein n=1 Tax=Erythroxylum novogranatense TaxID=1862640 RepID=A0AAV8SMV3_9ROSI|nr:hypothetical protein K2173_022821 [Erythroxylum novogranatense]